MVKSMSHSEAHCCYVCISWLKQPSFHYITILAAHHFPPQSLAAQAMSVTFSCCFPPPAASEALTSYPQALAPWLLQLEPMATGGSNVQTHGETCLGRFYNHPYSIKFQSYSKHWACCAMMAMFLTNAQRYLTAFTKWEAAQCHANVQAAWQHFLFFPRKASNESSTPAERVQQKARAFPLGGV